MKVTYPKVKIDSKNRVYISFYQNNKRYRLFNGSKINSEIYPNIFPNTKRLEMGHLLAAEVYTFLMSGLTIQEANISELIRPNMLDKDYLFIALNNKLKGNYTDNITIDKYQVGTSNQFNNSTVFWQMDNTGNIRSGKIMAYDIKTGKRRKNKDGKPLIQWVHSILKKPNYNLKQCLFGLHLLNDNVKKVAIVESEKTALILHIEFPNYIWMSTGSLNGFKFEYLAPLKRKTITAFPDKGGYDKWRDTADLLNNNGFEIEVSKLLENKEYEDGWDLVDVLNYENKE